MNNDDYVTVLEYNNKNVILVKFDHSGYEKRVRLSSLKTGGVLDPYTPMRYGQVFGEGPYTKRHHLNIYRAWASIFKRVFEPDSSSRNYTYERCSIDIQWFNYQVFAS